MNFYKIFFKTCPKYCLVNNKYMFNSKLHSLAFQKAIVNINHVKYSKSYLKSLFCSSYTSSEVAEIEDVPDLYPYSQIQNVSGRDIARKILYKDNNDSKIVDLGRCVSVEEVFNFVRNNSANLNYKYLTQIVLVLSDLQNIFFCHLDEETAVKQDFFRKLLEHQEFYIVLKSIEQNTYDPLFLSYTTLYLNKLGLLTESHLIQSLVIKIKNYLLENEFSLDISSRFLKVIFGENAVRPYFTAKDIIPKVFGEINSVKTLKELEDLTICLNILQNIMTDNVLNLYKKKVNEFIDNNILNSASYQILLKIIIFLNCEKSRNKSSVLLSKCILLMKDSIEIMNSKELEILYHVFFKNQEPGDALNTIQRASAKILHEQEENQLQRDSQLKLFTCLIFFSSPTHRVQFRRDIKKYLDEKETFNNLLNLRKIFSYLKISDSKMCDLLWTKVCQALKEHKELDEVSRFYESYVHFLSYNLSYRSLAFEHHIMRIIQKNFEAGELTVFPKNFFSAFSFALLFCTDFNLLNSLIGCFKSNKAQMSSVDILKISLALNLMRQNRNQIVTGDQLIDIRNNLNEVTRKIYTYNENIPTNTNLIKAAILRHDYENELIDEILQSLKQMGCMSSKIIERLSFSLFAPKALIPEVINKCTEYVIHNKDHILGFNAEKLLFLCYYLNYYPVYADKFFQCVTDVIIRDQERLSGLSFLQAALSLSYFHRLPKSFIKQIFNVEFLDKLDVELENCYHRDIYPHRVRSILMQLNRVVCLEYPEFNVPWFHQKYMDEYRKSFAKDDMNVNIFQLRVKDYLQGIINKNLILENIVAPYGYYINFVIHFDKDNNPTNNFENASNWKLALLLKSDNAFTRFYVHLKGKHELQNRHLEILGYKVKIIKWNEWANLLYASERIEFIKALVFS